MPSVSGDYRFFIASDDGAQLKLSPGENPSNAVVIASISGWSDPGQWTKYASQTSPLQTGLVAGQRYYLEVLQKEGGGGDHFEVAWLVPGSGVTNIIPAGNLQPADINHAPKFAGGASLAIFSNATNGQTVATVTATDSPLDTLTYKLVSGNSNSTFAIDAASGVVSVANNAAIAGGAGSTFPLVVAVQDSGYDGLYPLKSAQTNVTITVIAPGSLFWTGGGTAGTWSQSNNWGGAPLTAGARVVFGNPARQASTNDAVNQLASVQFTTGGFAAAGLPLTLQSGLTNTGNNTWAIGTTLGAAQTWRNAAGTLTVSGAITNSGHALTLVADSPVNFSGALSGTGALIKSGASSLALSAANPNSSRFSGPTTVSGGALTVTNLTGTLAVGHSFKLFAAAAYSGGFTVTNLPPLSSGLAWSWTPTNGTLAVVPAVNLAPTNFTATISGNQLTLTWPADHTGWTLQAQTNSLGVGLSPDGWHPIAGSSGTNSVAVTIDPAQPAVFHRLSCP